MSSGCMASSSHLELEPFAQQNDSESLGDIMPTYQDILQRSTLQIFFGGRCIGDIDPKGSVGGGWTLISLPSRLVVPGN